MKNIIIDDKKYKLVPVEEPQVQEKARTGWERVKAGELFFCVYCECTQGDMHDYSGDLSNAIYKSGNYFNDKQLCNDVGRAVSIYLRMLRWQAENDVPVELREPVIKKWYIRYHIPTKELYSSYVEANLGVFGIYFSTKEKAEECIKVFESDLIWLHTQFYHRLDGKGVDNA